MKYILLLTLLLGLTLGSFGQSKVITQREVYDKIVNAGLQHPEIVLRQAVNESANFKHKRAIQQSNYWGLMYKGTLRYFDTIDSCINFYKVRVQSRYTGGNYYSFLTRIGYAADKRYVKKLKDIELDFVIE